VNVFAVRELFAPPHVDQGQILPGSGLAGPGTIQPPAGISFNKVGPIRLNVGPSFIDEATSVFDFQWGSFDASTNVPTVYPSGSSISNLINQVLVLITLNPDTATVGTAYNGQIVVAGGTAPYSFSLTSYSPPLPPGITLSPSGQLSGTPLRAGTYTFVVTMSDAGGLVINKPLTLTVSP
jgi:hypothetical protein